MEPLDIELDEGELELPTDPMLLNMGPSHPAMHGTVRIVVHSSLHDALPCREECNV